METFVGQLGVAPENAHLFRHLLAPPIRMGIFSRNFSIPVFAPFGLDNPHLVVVPE